MPIAGDLCQGLTRGAPEFFGGFIGVDVFSVLSGFLITGILASEFRRSGKIDLPAFYWLRAVRLCPALFLMLVVYAEVRPSDIRSEVLPAALYVSNWTAAFWEYSHNLSHTWSLGAEQQFYLLFPLLLPPVVARHSFCFAWASFQPHCEC